MKPNEVSFVKYSYKGLETIKTVLGLKSSNFTFQTRKLCDFRKSLVRTKSKMQACAPRDMYNMTCSSQKYPLLLDKKHEAFQPYLPPKVVH